MTYSFDPERRNTDSFWLTVHAICIFLFAFISMADAREWQPWCETRTDLGWHFYCDPTQQKPSKPKPPEKATSKKAVAVPEPTAAPTATQQIARIRADTQMLKARAILEPTPSNLEAYMRKQAALTEMASRFADVWQRVIWHNPELDYESRHPQSNLGKKAATAQLNKDRRAVMARLHQRYGILYVGTARCPVCKIYGPTLRRFAGQWHLSVLAVSADGSALSGWPEAVADTGQLTNLGMPKGLVPLTALFDKTTNNITLLGVGFLADEDLMARIYAQTKEGIGDAF